jgi:opacity protein-like surface antigen
MNSSYLRRLMFLSALLMAGMASTARAAEVFVAVSFVQSFQESDLHGVGIDGGILFELSETVKIGPEIGWSNLGEDINDVEGPGTGYDRVREAFKTEMFHVTAAARIGKKGDGIRPYGAGGLGAYIFRAHDEINYFNQGEEVPELYFEESSSEIHPGFNLGGGARYNIGHSLGLGVDGRLDVTLGVGDEGVTAHPLGRISTGLSYGF